MICPKCGTQNLEGTRNCIRCGNELIQNTESVNLSNQNNSQVLGVQSNNSYNELNNINSEQNNTILNNESISINNLKYYWFGAPGYNLFLLILNLIIIIFNIFSIIGYFSKH